MFAAEREVDFGAVDGVDFGDFAACGDELADVCGLVENAAGVGSADGAAFEVAGGALFGGFSGFEASGGFCELGFAGDERAWFAGAAEGFPVVEGLGGASGFFGDGGFEVAVVEFDEDIALFEEAAFAEGGCDVDDDAADFSDEGAFGACSDFAAGGEEDGIILGLDCGGGDWDGWGGAA